MRARATQNAPAPRPQIEYRSWRTLWCTRRARVPVFGRLALVFRARSEADAAALDDEAAGSSWLRRTLASNPLRHRVIKVAETPVSANHVYLKLFRVGAAVYAHSTVLLQLLHATVTHSCSCMHPCRLSRSCMHACVLRGPPEAHPSSRMQQK